jgi:hypothetical protein
MIDDDDLIVTSRKVDELLLGHVGWEALRRIDEWWFDVGEAMMDGITRGEVKMAREYGLVWVEGGIGRGGKLLM